MCSLRIIKSGLGLGCTHAIASVRTCGCTHKHTQRHARTDMNTHVQQAPSSWGVSVCTQVEQTLANEENDYSLCGPAAGFFQREQPGQSGIAGFQNAIPRTQAQIEPLDSCQQSHLQSLKCVSSKGVQISKI